MSNECPSCGWPIIPPVLDDPRDAEIARLRKVLRKIAFLLESEWESVDEIKDFARKALEPQK